MGANSTSLPYWQVNVPPDERAEECPDFLRDIGAKDVKTLSTPDAEYTRLSWPAVRELVASHRLDDFQRVPTELRRYIAYGRKLARDHGSVMNFVLAHRLGWTAPVVPADSRPFACPDDFKILCNDWPYGLDERIVHLVVWTKFELEEEPGARDVKDGTRAVIDAFVDRVFSPHLPKDHVSRSLCIPLSLFLLV